MIRILPTRSRPNRSGFTLLEVSAAMGVMVILAAGIFSLTSGSFKLTEELSEFQKRNVMRKRFIELCRTNLEDVPGHARVEFKVADRGQDDATYLSIVDDPFAFTFGGNPANVRRVILEADVASGGFLRAALLYLNEEENIAYENDNLDPANVQRRVVLMKRLRQLSWRFYDTNRQEWIEYWDQPRNPTLVELSLALEGETTPERAVFWIPPEKPVPAARNNPTPDEDEDEDEAEAEDESEDESENETESESEPVSTPPIRPPR